MNQGDWDLYNNGICHQCGCPEAAHVSDGDFVVCRKCNESRLLRPSACVERIEARKF